MDIWQVLQGSVQQQRVWTMGKQQLAAPALPAPLPGNLSAGSATQDRQCHTSSCYDCPALRTKSSKFEVQPPPPQQQQQRRRQSSAGNAVIEDGCITNNQYGNNATIFAESLEAAAIAGADLPQSCCISSCQPVSIKDGVRFISCSAGHQHSAAVADNGFVYVWGSNDHGQCGVDTQSQPPVALHLLHKPDDNIIERAASPPTTCCQSCARVMPQSPAGRSYRKTDSLTAVARDTKLPASLLNALVQQHQRDMQEAQDLQQVAVERDLLLAPQDSLSACNSKQPQQHQQHRVMADEALGQAATCKVLGHQPLDPPALRSPPQQAAPVLAIYRLPLGQAVKMVACGGKHTIAALAASGLVTWGLNDKGQ
jgi:hypothetical protein